MSAKHDSKQIFALVKIAGIVTVIPFMLAAYIALGYLFGHVCDEKFATGPAGAVIGTAIGLWGAVRETMRFIRFALHVEEETHAL